MLQLPTEILIKIFGFLHNINDLIATSMTCKRFNEIIRTHVKELSICFGANISKNEIDKILLEIPRNFTSVRAIRLKILLDELMKEKTKFCETFSDVITELEIREMSFLNTILDVRKFTSLKALHIHKSDLTSSSTELVDFILQGCPNLRSLCISSCEGLDVESLNILGSRLDETQVEEFKLLPSFAYFDVASDSSEYWKIDKLKTLSIRSNPNEVVVMKKGFIRKILGITQCPNLTSLELAAEINFGENLVPLIVSNFPNLKILVLTRGVSIVKNQDFTSICNNLKHLTKLEFHFPCDDKDLKMQQLKRNSTIEDLTIGIASDFPISNLKSIRKLFSSLKDVSVIYYNFKSSSSQDFHSQLMEIFPQVQFHRTGQKSNLE